MCDHQIKMLILDNFQNIPLDMVAFFF